MSDPYDDDYSNRKRRRDDFPFGGDFNDFFKYIQKMLENFLDSDLSAEFDKMFRGEGTNPFVWGFSFKRDAEGRPKIERFGTFSPEKIEPDMETGVREPLIDVLDEPDVIRVIAELPGVEKDQIDLRTTETKMVLKAQGDRNRKYHKKINFNESIIPESAKAKFKNGVLEVVFKKKNPQSTGKKIPIQ